MKPDGYVPPALHTREDLIVSRSMQTMTNCLRKHPGFGPIVIAYTIKSSTEATTPVIVTSQAAIESYENLGVTLLKSNGMPEGWSVEKPDGWIPSGANLINGHIQNFDALRDATGLLMQQRTGAIKDAVYEAVGKTISNNIRKAEKKDLPEPKSDDKPNMWLWLAAIAGGSYLAYRYRDSIKKMMK